MNEYHPGDVGKVGTRHYHLKGNQSFCATVNLDKLLTLVGEKIQISAVEDKTEAVLSLM